MVSYNDHTIDSVLFHIAALECVDEVDHVRLACYFCVHKGVQDHILDVFRSRVMSALDVESLLGRYAWYTVDTLARHIWPVLGSTRQTECQLQRRN